MSDLMTSGEASPCRTCGACCATFASWPRFSMETDAALVRIPSKFVAADLSGMRCHGDRCSALIGNVGVSATCAIYEVRPDVCRACEVGDDACQTARIRHGLPAIEL